MAVGGDWGVVDDTASIRTLHHAFARGVTFGDSAYIYPSGHSETVMGRALKALCAPYYPTLAEAAMRYVLSCPELSCVIPGILNLDQVDMNVAYSDGAPFPADLKASLTAHVWPRNFYQ